jgi:hypothetical protein
MSTFGFGKYRTRSGNKAIVNEIVLGTEFSLKGRILNSDGDVDMTPCWRRDGRIDSVDGIESPYDLIEPWTDEGVDEHH